MSSFSIVRGGDVFIVFNHDNGMFNIQELSDSIGCKNILSSVVKDPLNGSMYVMKEISDQKWGDIVALVRFGCLLNKSIVKEIIVKSIRLWVDICGMSYSDIKSSTSDPIYNTFLFSGYMSLAGDNPDLKNLSYLLGVECLDTILMPMSLPSYVYGYQWRYNSKRTGSS